MASNEFQNILTQLTLLSHHDITNLFTSGGVGSIVVRLSTPHQRFRENFGSSKKVNSYSVLRFADRSKNATSASRKPSA